MEDEYAMGKQKAEEEHLLREKLEREKRRLSRRKKVVMRRPYLLFSWSYDQVEDIK
jgi:hypothetical protein